MNSIKNQTLLLGLCCCTALLLSAPATADLFGSTLSWQYYAYGGPYSTRGGETSGSFVVDGGIGGTFSAGSEFLYFNIIADATSITFDYSITTAPSPWTPSGLSLGPTIHNGIAIDMVSALDFVDVTINPATNMVGFDASRISFTANQIQVDWQNLPFDSATIVKLDVVTIPAPASLVFLGSALAAVTRRRRT